jgi:SulP family sulfate permease
MVGAMAGLLLVVPALARLGRLMRYLPTPVIEGVHRGDRRGHGAAAGAAALGVTDAHGDNVWAVAGDDIPYPWPWRSGWPH